MDKQLSKFSEFLSERFEKPGFERDLRRGKEFEFSVLRLVKKKFPQAHLSEGKVKEYDIFIPETGETIEVKADYMSALTGKFVIEVSMNGHDSGLTTTKSTYWMLITPSIVITIKPEDIRRIIMSFNYDIVTITGNGDKRSKQVYFINVNQLIDFSLNVFKTIEIL